MIGKVKADDGLSEATAKVASIAKSLVYITHTTPSILRNSPLSCSGNPGVDTEKCQFETEIVTHP